MTEPNIFQEVQEDLERQRLEALWKQYGGWVIILALGIVLATASSTAYRSWKAEKNEKITAQLLESTRPGLDAPQSIDLLEKFADANQAAGQAVFAYLRAGALAAEANDKTKAITLFDKAAGDTNADPAFRQLGDLLSVQAQLDSGDTVALSARLQPLTGENQAWRYSALETQAYLALRQNDPAHARQIFTQLSQDARTPPTIAARATDILRSLN
jgi:hypothetical protein